MNRNNGRIDHAHVLSTVDPQLLTINHSPCTARYHRSRSDGMINRLHGLFNMFLDLRVCLNIWPRDDFSLNDTFESFTSENTTREFDGMFQQLKVYVIFEDTQADRKGWKS